MIQYIKLMAEEVRTHLEKQRHFEQLPSMIGDLRKELDDLRTLDFPPDKRFQLVGVRRRIKDLSAIPDAEWRYVWEKLTVANQVDHGKRLRKLLVQTGFAGLADGKDLRQMAEAFCEGVREVLAELNGLIDSYLGPDVRGKVRTFSFMKNTSLKCIAERDYHDLMVKLHPSEAWKSVVIHCGSILEAVLCDLLTRDATRTQAANAARRAPPKFKAPKGTKRDITSDHEGDEWTLNNFIEVADELRLLPEKWKVGVQAVLRDFRNYVHPRREVRAADQITQGEAMQSMGLLIKVLDHIEAKHP